MTQRIARQRIVTFADYETGDIQALTEMEYFQQVTAPGKTLDELCPSGEWSDFVWQWAPDKPQAIANHNDKVDLWHKNPDRRTY